MCKKSLFILLFTCCAISSMAQSLTIVEEFKIIENSSVLVAYHNQFSDYEKPQMDDTFPYAVVRVLLEGNANEVTSAKKMLGVYTGLLSEGVKASCLDFENEILFLVPSNVGHVELSCGEGCTRQIILHLQHLQSNAVYVGKVHYTPMDNSTPMPDPNFTADVQGLRAYYVEGDQLEFEITPRLDSYVKIFLFVNETTAYRIYPNELERPHLLKANTRYSFPTSSNIEYTMEKDTNEAIEINHIVFVFTKEEVPFYHPTTSRVEIEKWISMLPNDTKFLYSTTYEIRKK